MFGVEDILQRCAANAKSLPLRVKIDEEQEKLVSSEDNFRARSVAQAWWKYKQIESVGSLGKDELISLYTIEMSSPRGCSHDFYAKIKNSAPHNKCPLCGVGVVSSVDHYLPKSRYPDLSTTPINLIPACNDCNTFKHVRFPKNASDQTLHPYFDDFSGAEWLLAEVLDVGHQPVVQFHVDSSGAYNSEDEGRLRTHFSALRLARLFGANAAEALTTERDNLVRTHDASGKEGVSAYLSERVDAYSAIHLNSWQTAFYKALSGSEWFVSGGFLSIPS